MPVPIVDKDDKIITYKSYDEIDEAQEITRSSGLMIFNGRGDILLAQRNTSTTVDPGCWGEAASGTVENDDSYLETILREAEEELDIHVSDLVEGPKQYIDSPYKCFIQWYTIQLDKSLDYFHIHKMEVQQIKWLNKEQLKADVAANPDLYVTLFQQTLDLF